MLARVVILLLLANAGWCAWTQGWLAPLGLAPATQREPERLERQVNPQSLRVAPLDFPPAGESGEPPGTSMADAPAPAAAAPTVVPPASSPEAPADTAEASVSATAGGTCLVAGVFDQQQIVGVREAATARLPAGRWRVDTVPLPGRWMIYIGKLPDAGALAARRAELRGMGVDFDRPGAALEPGLSLGRFPNEDAAERGLKTLERKGVRGARVVAERRDTPGYVLRLPDADAALRARARALRPAMGGRDFRACD